LNNIKSLNERNEAGMEYVLITTAKNEEKYIENTINSVLSQTLLPQKWIIVSDGSIDRTDEIVRSYEVTHDFIKCVRRDESISNHDFASKVKAFQLGYRELNGITYDFIGNLDGDVSFNPLYYETILNRFQKKTGLGIAGGFIYEERNGIFLSRPSNDVGYVSGSVQLFRRKCFEMINGYVPIKAGGEDTVAVVMSHMKGWKVESFPDIKVFHHKKATSARGVFRESFRDGVMWYALGSHPIYEIVKTFYKMNKKPYLLGAVVRLMGFVWSYCSKKERSVTREFIEYLRREQIESIVSRFSI